MLLKCSVIACLVAVTMAQTPTRPVFPSTFYASGEVELHVAEETRFGKFKLARDQVKLMGVEENTFDRGEVEEVLQRYDQKKTYYIRGLGEDAHCISMESNGFLAPFWEWMDRAVYEGERTVHERSLDLWGYSIADVRFEVGVDKEIPNVPAFYNRLSAEDFVNFQFQMFNGTTPSSSYFVVPGACEE